MMLSILGAGMPGWGQPVYRNWDPGVAYLGSEQCAICHADIYRRYQQSAMGQSMGAVSDELPELQPFNGSKTFYKPELDRYFSVFRKAGRVFHSEYQVGPDGKMVFTDIRAVSFAVGSGRRGRSYVVKEDGHLFQSPISYYASRQDWDLSPGYQSEDRGFTKPITPSCAFCHAGEPRPVESTLNRYRDPPFQAVAIHCERCHGPGEIHIRERIQTPDAGAIDLTIVNPSRLAPSLREDICMQCHLIGDARVLRPGKQMSDFRPGRPLDEVLSVYSVPLSQPDLLANQVLQLRRSQCWKQSAGKLGCITCHDPHSQPAESEAEHYFRQRCLQCHGTEDCALAPERRRNSGDNCVRCHMPRRASSTIPHTGLTDHRITRFPRQSALTEAPAEVAGDLIHQNAAQGEKADIAILARAYAQLGLSRPGYRPKALETIQAALERYREDKELAELLGQYYLLVGPQIDEAETILRKALELGSRRPHPRVWLAQINEQRGDRSAAIEYLEQALELDKYTFDAYIPLARLYGMSGRHEKGLQILRDLLKIQPGHQVAREALERLGRSKPDPGEGRDLKE